MTPKRLDHYYRFLWEKCRRRGVRASEKLHFHICKVIASESEAPGRTRMTYWEVFDRTRDLSTELIEGW